MTRSRILPDKPLLAMDELEHARAWDVIRGDLDVALLVDARERRSNVRVAVAVLTLADGQRRVVDWRDEAGDGEGTGPISHLVARAVDGLRSGEAIGFELLDLALSPTGTWSVNSHVERPMAQGRWDEIISPEDIRQTLNTAREVEADVVLAVGVLTLPSGERRVVLADAELGDGQARRGVADLLRRARRLKVLEEGESLDRLLVKVTISQASWRATSRADPLRGAR